jgi:membrane-associated phospholipid phosphatase
MFSLVAIARPASAEECTRAAPWSRLGDTATHYAAPLPLSLTAGSALAPVALSPTGLDHRLRVVNQRDLGGRPNLEPVSVATPYALGGVLIVGYVVSVVADDCRWERRQAATLQGMALTLVVATGLKFAVGRQWPNAGLDPSLPDRLDHPEFAREFRPFQRFGAWPSGHTAVMFAAAAAFRTSNPELGWPAWLGYPLALGVGAGMWWGDHHFASDIVSGALLGEAIGSSAGSSFAEPATPKAVAVVPLDDGLLVTWTGAW